ncbi:hypothetical protein RB195_003382 [Necator americanus]|uniref:Peptidase family M13 n=1 Tax=Necator americanus TaxID=51031 RepID=A0ABR1DR31_NECAM
MRKDFENYERAFLQSEDNFKDSRAINSAQLFHQKCLSSDNEWSSNGGPIYFVLKNIRRYGYFPLIDGDLWEEKDYNLTSLLAYFNRNKTILVSLVPKITVDYLNSSKAIITFQPVRSVISYIYQSLKKNGNHVKSNFIELLWKVVRQICIDTKSKCDNNKAYQELLHVYEFMSALEKITEPSQDYEKIWIRSPRRSNLSSLDSGMTSINWTTYLNLISSHEISQYIGPDLIVNAPPVHYMRDIDDLLDKTPKHTITNYVMLMYVLSWIELLDTKYRSGVEDFLKRSGVPLIPKEYICYTQTRRIYLDAMMALQAHRNNGKEGKRTVTDMTEELSEAFKDIIQENTWMEKASKTVLLQKLLNMSKYILYDDIHLGDVERLDNSYKDYLLEDSSQNLTFLEIADKFNRLQTEHVLKHLDETVDARNLMASKKNEIRMMSNPSYIRRINEIWIRAGILQFPLFEFTFPKSYSYGSIGSILGHEIMHGFDNDGKEFGEHGKQKWFRQSFGKQFQRKSKCYVHQYTTNVLFYDDRKVTQLNLTNNGEITLTEDIADNEGMKLAIKAYKTYQKKHGSESRFESMEDFENDQMFFLGFAAKSCAKYSMKGLLSSVTIGIHSVKHLRVNNVLANTPLFAEAFHCAPGAALNPEKREMVSSSLKNVDVVYSMQKTYTCRILLLCVHVGCTNIYHIEDTCRDGEFAVGNSTGYRNLQRLLSHSLDFSTDPCEDFYQFVCGRWIQNASKKDFAVSHTLTMKKNFEKSERAFLQSEDNFNDSRALKSAQLFHQKCLSSDNEWSSNGGPINFVIKNIRRYGYFPLIDGNLWQEKDYNLTSLLAYFNRNKTILLSLVPKVTIDHLNSSNAIITFQPVRSIISHIYQSLKRNGNHVESDFIELLRKVVNQICMDTNSKCDNNTTNEELLRVYKFMNDLEKIAEPTQDYEQAWIRSYRRSNLSSLDNEMTSINWTTYLDLIVPSEMKQYIVPDLKVNAPSERYLRDIDKLLNETLKHVVTNYVMLMYALSWIELLDEKYRSPVEVFLRKSRIKTISKEYICYTQTRRIYLDAMMALHAHRNNGKEGRKIVGDMTEELGEAFKDMIKENTWMGNPSKRVLEQKFLNMSKHILYDDIHLTDMKSLDTLYENYLLGNESQNLTFLEIADTFNRLYSENILKHLNKSVDARNLMGRRKNELRKIVNAAFVYKMNEMWIGPGILQFPRFQFTFPKSYTYGSVGTTIGHEIIHGFDDAGRDFGEHTKEKWFREHYGEQFRQRAECYVRQYTTNVLCYDDGKVTSLNLTSNGKFTLRENIADNEGMKLAVKAYKAYQKKHGSESRFESMEDFDSDQMFFIGYATKACTRYSMRVLLSRLATDVHSIKHLRINNVVANTPLFAKAFHCAPGTPLNPERRCSIF